MSILRGLRSYGTKLAGKAYPPSETPLVLSPKQLQDLVLTGEPVKVLDASWFMPNSPRKGLPEFLSKRIPGAQFLDLDEVASPHDLGLKHMMPTERVFADACEKFGISPSSHVVIYDSHGVFSSPRALFMFKSFGHIQSSILNGGLPLWEAAGFPVESGSLKETPRSEYSSPRLNAAAIRGYDQMVSNSTLNPLTSEKAEFVLDARSNGRYLGTDPEPRPGLSSGHIPNSFSLPFNVFLQNQTASNGTPYTILRPADELRDALVKAVGELPADLIIQGKAPVATTCGSGMTAGVLWLGLKSLGVKNVGLYDESWTGYAMRESSKIEKN